ncbi:MAG: glycoprotease family metalloendopeptidase, O-sialoglycoprotein endopeptidase [Candidatus Peregrinibacteria bacterium GW2011_GWC2_39_14]|nr:MAG: putative tRNA threonylcarbamoyladenosine biosynthesis protein Gcp [Candidatus Peregrinibacteria bacterium GW2011_GWA2_38_36]KKR06614.1 MAG: glycoprotease family metalloendopeptidase, O-sialoglycoprotein endopeptidase [Candidatus Peregrinibacteria bacterium GW2011_GWC2_39_14]
MKILGIETSCDETSCAVVENGTRVLSNVIFSQIKLHAKTGGVVPEVAAREHVVKIIPVLKSALDKAKLSMDEIDAIAVTARPGLLSSLLIGTTTANTLGLFSGKPVIPVQHIEGHIYSNWLDGDGGNSMGTEAIQKNAPKFPILILTVSGGHNEIFLMRDHMKFELIGETVDDAAGEAFDKVARLLGLPYPGGPSIMKAAETGNKNAFKFPRAMMKDKTFNFSFSGIKTSVLYFMEKEKRAGRKPTKKFVNDVAASFQEAVIDALATKLMMAVKKYPNIKEVHLAGGVSANIKLREEIAHRLKSLNDSNGAKITFRYPQKFEYCTDNAAMIASAGYFKSNLDQSLSRAACEYVEASAEF